MELVLDFIKHQGGRIPCTPPAVLAPNVPAQGVAAHCPITGHAPWNSGIGAAGNSDTQSSGNGVGNEDGACAQLAWGATIWEIWCHNLGGSGATILGTMGDLWLGSMIHFGLPCRRPLQRTPTAQARRPQFV
jgi:hypothetical protein